MFRDRTDAGRRLAAALTAYRDQQPVVIALPRGGVPIGYEIARALDAPLDVTIVRKLGAPRQPELGIGAVGERGVRVLNDRLIAELGVTAPVLDAVVARETAEIERRLARYRGDRPRSSVAGRTVILVDDGLATGFTARAAVDIMRGVGARSVVLAVPVAPPEAVAELANVADAVVCLATPTPFRAIGEWYDDFRQLSDEDVVALLPGPERRGPAPPRGPMTSAAVRIAAGGVTLHGDLNVPAEGGRGIVLFAHGSGSSRRSPRNRAVAGVLNQAGHATLLFDLLTEHEASDRRYVFAIDLLADRLVATTKWVGEHPSLAGAPLGYFGASTGAAAALAAAAQLGPRIGAVVSRGGRPDLAGAALPDVTAPTLLLVGSLDVEVLRMNREAASQMRCEHSLEIVPGATHLFEEPGALERVAHAATSWFTFQFERVTTATG